MKIPPLFGNPPPQSSFFIYTACDTVYFEQFGKALINSIHQNTNHPIHIHLYNPTSDQLQYCKDKKVTVSYENVKKETGVIAAIRLTDDTDNDIDRIHKERTNTAMKKGDDTCFLDRVLKTYYACARFIRLDNLILPNQSVFTIDSDAIVRKDFPLFGNDVDLYIRKNKQFLAGGVWITPTGHSFLHEWAERLIAEITNDNIFWTLDQEILDQIVPNYSHQELPMSLIDWKMSPDSYIWTAKGKRKDLEVFTDLLKKYAV